MALTNFFGSINLATQPQRAAHMLPDDCGYLQDQIEKTRFKFKMFKFVQPRAPTETELAAGCQETKIQNILQLHIKNQKRFSSGPGTEQGSFWMSTCCTDLAWYDTPLRGHQLQHSVANDCLELCHERNPWSGCRSLPGRHPFSQWSRAFAHPLSVLSVYYLMYFHVFSFFAKFLTRIMQNGFDLGMPNKQW